MRLVTQSAKLKCAHGGVVMVIPTPCVVRVEGKFAMTQPAPAGATVVGCPTPTPPIGPGPCLALLPGITGYSQLLRIDGQPACLETLQGMTEHPGGLLVLDDPGQDLVTVQD